MAAPTFTHVAEDGREYEVEIVEHDAPDLETGLTQAWPSQIRVTLNGRDITDEIDTAYIFEAACSFLNSRPE